MEVDWTGPFRWPRIGEPSVRFFGTSGVYLWTVEYHQGGYLIYAAGIT